VTELLNAEAPIFPPILFAINLPIKLAIKIIKIELFLSILVSYQFLPIK